jgi:hypothetical protein
MRHSFSRLVLCSFVPLCLAAKGDGCAASSRTPAPDVTGDWNIAYDDVIDVTVRIGGATYDRQISAAGGVIDIDHNGQPLQFDLDCSRPEIVCPSEAWPETISVEQRNQQFEHRMIVTLPNLECTGELVDPEPDSCGPGTDNPDCEQVCNGDVEVRESQRFGVIGEDGESFRLYLGAGLATNGINCALLGVSLADADLVNSGEPGAADWRAEEMGAGLVTVAYGGACLWAGDPDMDQQLEALVLGASIEFRTGFTGTRQ